MLSVDVAKALASDKYPLLLARVRAVEEIVGFETFRVTIRCDFGLVGGDGELPFVAFRLPEGSKVDIGDGSSRGVCASENLEFLFASVGAAGVFLMVGVTTLSSSVDLS